MEFNLFQYSTNMPIMIMESVSKKAYWRAQNNYCTVLCTKQFLYCYHQKLRLNAVQYNSSKLYFFINKQEM